MVIPPHTNFFIFQRWNIPTYVFRTAAYINVMIIIFLWTLYLLIIVRHSDVDGPVDNSFRSIMVMILEMVETIYLVKVPKALSNEPWYKMLIYYILLFDGLFLKMFTAGKDWKFWLISIKIEFNNDDPESVCSKVCLLCINIAS